MADCWTLKVLEAFRDEINRNAAVAADTVDPCYVGWPSSGFLKRGPWRAFVWFDPDKILVADGSENHELTVVTGIIFKADPSATTETELAQAIAAWYGIRAALVLAADTPGSEFDAAFDGLTAPHPDGVSPSDGDDFDGIMAIGERWTVSCGLSIA